MSRLSAVLCLCILCEWAVAVTAVRAQDIAGCNLVSSIDSLQFTIHDENHRTLSGTEAVPVRIDCDNLQLFANKVDPEMVCVCGMNVVLSQVGLSQLKVKVQLVTMSFRQ